MGDEVASVVGAAVAAADRNASARREHGIGVLSDAWAPAPAAADEIAAWRRERDEARKMLGAMVLPLERARAADQRRLALRLTGAAPIGGGSAGRFGLRFDPFARGRFAPTQLVLFRGAPPSAVGRRAIALRVSRETLRAAGVADAAALERRYLSKNPPPMPESDGAGAGADALRRYAAAVATRLDRIAAADEDAQRLLQPALLRGDGWAAAADARVAAGGQADLLVRLLPPHAHSGLCVRVQCSLRRSHSVRTRIERLPAAFSAESALASAADLVARVEAASQRAFGPRTGPLPPIVPDSVALFASFLGDSSWKNSHS